MIDFGQNFTGNIVFEIDGKEGEILSFLPAEVLTKEGNFYFDNYRDAKSYFKYTLKNGKNILRPLFSFQGLRYIKLVDIQSNFDISCVKGHVIHSRLERTCYFDCGNEKINQLYHNIIYGPTESSNLISSAASSVLSLNTIALSMQCCSSLTFPGQICFRSFCLADVPSTTSPTLYFPE